MRSCLLFPFVAVAVVIASFALSGNASVARQSEVRYCQEFIAVDDIVPDPRLDIDIGATLEVVTLQDERFFEDRLFDQFVIRWSSAAQDNGADCMWVGQGPSGVNYSTPNLAEAVLDPGAREWVVTPMVDSDGGRACYRLLPMSASGVGRTVELCADVVNVRIPEFPHGSVDATPGPPDVGSGGLATSNGRSQELGWAIAIALGALLAGTAMVLRRSRSSR
jgi:hypothetical protein